MFFGYKFRLYPNGGQRERIEAYFAAHRLVYNALLALQIEEFERRKCLLSLARLRAFLFDLISDDPFLEEIEESVLDSAAELMLRNFKTYLRLKKSGQEPSYPRFKSEGDRYKSFKIKNRRDNIAFTAKHVWLPGFSKMRCRVSRFPEGRFLSVTVSQVPSGKYFIALNSVRRDVEPLPKTGRAVGIDLGLSDIIVTSDGEKFEHPAWFLKSEEKVKSFQRVLAGKERGSRAYERAERDLARQHEKIANQRRDWLHKLSSEMVQRYDVICVENLAVREMMQEGTQAKAIADASWTAFRKMLQYKSQRCGRAFIMINRYFPSSQRCSSCAYTDGRLKDPRIRTWRCPACAALHDRDINAAINILNEGLRIYHFEKRRAGHVR